MSRLTWNAPERRFFETGLDRGVLFPKGVVPPGEVLSTNYVTNPAPTALAGTAVFSNRWMGNGGTGTHSIVTGNRPDGTTGPFARKQWTGAVASPEGSGDTGFTIIPNNASLTVQEGDVVRVGAWLRSNRSFGGYGSIYFTVDRGNSVNFDRAIPANTWEWVEVAHTIPAGETGVWNVPLDPLPSGAWQVDDTFDMFGVVVTKNEKDPIGAYFSGDTLDTGVVTYEWTGAANNSTSIKRAVRTLAVPWDGLTSVEESGGEGARAYYVDGRPFLFLPMPKEYKATLNAYTYPDAFSSIMGLAEVTDGMYLDSQPGQSFDLAYRTLVGNAAEGQDHGYKIHLVYNATVTPGAVNYETLSDSVNPSTMSWEVQAVPVRVEGFRPTAHIVIDTRHMDENKIRALEDLLYGSETNVAGMPPPQLVFDILNYGDTIIVTDNGDGTFDVEGSYENVYLVGDGEFRVDNVDGQNNGDGTFTISTTEG